jgi:hypothetical protein
MKYLGMNTNRKFNVNTNIDRTVAKPITLINRLAGTAKYNGV